MGSAMRATAEPAEGNRVRLTVEVDETEIDEVLGEAIRTISRQVRVPGFRPGKVPRQVLEARMGGAVALRAEALREAIPDFYARAVVDAEVDPIAPPEIDITAGEEEGALAFDAVVEVRPTVAVPGYGGLRVTLPSPAVTDAEVDAQVDRLRETEAELVEVARPAVDTDNVTIDVRGVAADGREVVNVVDYLYEVGSGRVVPELDGVLAGAKVGDALRFSAVLPDGEEPVDFTVLVKEIKEKQLPELTDAWADESSEFPTVAALRAGLGERIAKVKAMQCRMLLRDGALAALVELVDDDEVPAVLVDAEVQQRLHDLGHRLEGQRLTIEQFLEMTGRSGDELVAEVRVDAHRAVKADLALRAVADAEGLEVSDDELAAEIAVMAERMETDPEALRQQIDRAGRTLAVRSERRKAKALEWLTEHVEVVDEEGAPIPRALLAEDEAEGTGETGGGDMTEEPIDETQGGPE